MNNKTNIRVKSPWVVKFDPIGGLELNDSLDSEEKLFRDDAFLFVKNECAKRAEKSGRSVIDEIITRLTWSFKMYPAIEKKK